MASEKEGKYFACVSEEYLNQLPVKSFEGKIHLIDTPAKLHALKPALMKADILGFDTETKPAFIKGRHNKVAMLQLATDHTAYLIRLNRVGLADFLVQILEDENIPKVGVAIRDDLRTLNRMQSFEPGGFIELQDYVKDFGIADNGLKKLVANILGFRISKKNQTSNWEREQLTEDQLIYAATDAWVCLEIYKELNLL